MDVSEVRFKLILCLLLLFPPLLLSNAFAYPDLYFYNNFLVGQSPFSVDETEFTQLSESDMWEAYFPSVADDTDSNLVTGVVTTFNDKFMSGSTVPSSVPLVNVDTLVGRRWTLKPGQTQVLYSKSAEFTTVYATNSGNLTTYVLGTTHPINYDSNDGYALKSDGSPVYDTGSNNLASFNVFNSNFSKVQTNDRSIRLRDYPPSNPQSAYSPYDWSYVVMVWNKGTTDSILYLNYNEYNTAPEIEVSSIDINAVHWIVTLCHTLNNSSSSFARYSVIPHIKGSINIYSFPYHTILNDSLEHNFAINTFYDQVYTITYSASADIYHGFWNFSGNTNLYQNKRSSVIIPISYLSASSEVNNIPIFLDESFFINLYAKALYIRNGYIDITNYDELITKLQEAGIGGGDLTQVIALLEQINSGGDTGQAVADLMNILDSYHDSIVGTGDNGWTTINNSFDLYKHLLDFSADSIHWIVVANNALFNYFSGFLILCAFFLIIDRIMR